MDPAGDREGALEGRVAASAERLVEEALAEVRDEIKEVLKERLLQAAMQHLGDEPGAPPRKLPPNKRPTVMSDIDNTVRAIAEGAAPDERSELFGPDDTGCWVYGITRSGPSPPVAQGISPTASVSFVDAEGLRAIVSRVRLADVQYGGDVADMNRLGEQAVAHEAVLAAALEAGPVLPLRFGTIFRDEEEIRQTLATHRAALAESLDRLSGRAEWDVKVLCRPETLASWVTEHSTAATSLLADDVRGEGAAFMRRRRLERVVDEETERLAEGLGGEVAAVLSEHAEETVPAAAALVSNPEGLRLVRSDAYLVASVNRSDFERAAAEAENRFAMRGCVLRVVGPLPPYRFISLDLGERAGA